MADTASAVTGPGHGVGRGVSGGSGRHPAQRVIHGIGSPTDAPSEGPGSARVGGDRLGQRVIADRQRRAVQDRRALRHGGRVRQCLPCYAPGGPRSGRHRAAEGVDRGRQRRLLDQDQIRRLQHDLVGDPFTERDIERHRRELPGPLVARGLQAGVALGGQAQDLARLGRVRIRLRGRGAAGGHQIVQPRRELGPIGPARLTEVDDGRRAVRGGGDVHQVRLRRLHDQPQRPAPPATAPAVP